MLESTGSHGRGVERRVTRDETHGRSIAHRPDLCEQSVTRLGRSTLLPISNTPRQDDRKVSASFINKLFRFFSLPAVFVTITITITITMLVH